MRDKNDLCRRAPAVEVESTECQPDGAESLRPQSGPQDKRERQNQRPGSEVRTGSRASANWRRASIGRLVITNRRGASTAGVFPRGAGAAKAAASAPLAAYCMTSKSDAGERSSIGQIATIGR